MKALARRARSWLPGLVLAGVAVVATGCGPDRRVHLNYAHPSPLTRWGRHIWSTPLVNEGVAAISRQIEEGLRGSPTFVFDPEHPQMVVSGELFERSIGAEQLTTHAQTCTRMVPEQRTRQVPVLVNDPVPPPPANPGPYYVPPLPTTHTEMRTETYTEMVPQGYPCIGVVRSIAAALRVVVRINARTRPIHTIFLREYSVQDAMRTTGLRGSDSEDHEPAPVYGEAVARQLETRVAADVLHAILPRGDQADIQFADCGDARCENAIRLVRAGNFATAEELFSLVITGLGTPAEEQGRRHLGAALFNRGATRGFRGQLAEGIDDVTRALRLDASHDDWSTHLAELRRLQQEEQASQFRGETTQDPASGQAESPATARHPRPGHHGRPR